MASDFDLDDRPFQIHTTKSPMTSMPSSENEEEYNDDHGFDTDDDLEKWEAEHDDSSSNMDDDLLNQADQLTSHLQQKLQIETHPSQNSTNFKHSSFELDPLTLDLGCDPIHINNHLDSSKKHSLRKEEDTSSRASTSSCASSRRKINDDSIRTVKRITNLQVKGLHVSDKLIAKGVFGNVAQQVMKEKDEHSTEKISVKQIQEKMDRLAHHNPAKNNRKHATDEDQKNCRFKPFKAKAHLASMDKCGYDFLDNIQQRTEVDISKRMLQAEIQRKEKLERIRAEEAYADRANKKECPSCGVQQSYAEFRDKKKRCTSCGTEFRSKNAWGEVGKTFLDRMQKDIEKKRNNHEKIRIQVTHAETSKAKKTAYQKYYEKIIKEKTSHDFMKRMEMDATHRSEKK